MAEPIPYETPLPAGFRLRYVVRENGVRISREMPRKLLLWSEAVAPFILVGCAFLVWLFIWRLPNRFNLMPDTSKILQIAGCVLLGVWIFVNGRRAWQNVGIVMEVAVSGETLYWSKLNVWGTREYIWQLPSIKRVTVQNRLLKVYQRNGPALTAFSFVKQEERDYASAILNQAIARQRQGFKEVQSMA